MFYDIVIVVNHDLIAKYPEYADVTHVVLATAYAEPVAKTITSVLQAMADDGSILEIHARKKDVVDTSSFGPVYGVFTDD